MIFWLKATCLLLPNDSFRKICLDYILVETYNFNQHDSFKYFFVQIIIDNKITNLIVLANYFMPFIALWSLLTNTSFALIYSIDSFLSILSCLSFLNTRQVLVIWFQKLCGFCRTPCPSIPLEEEFCAQKEISTMYQPRVDQIWPQPK